MKFRNHDLGGRGSRDNIYKVSFSEEELQNRLNSLDSADFGSKLQQSVAEEAVYAQIFEYLIEETTAHELGHLLARGFCRPI